MDQKKSGHDQFDGAYLTIDDEKYHLVDGKYETLENVQAQSSFIYADRNPITKDDLDSRLGTVASPAQTTISSESDSQQSSGAYEIWTITKHNTGIFDEYREKQIHLSGSLS